MVLSEKELKTLPELQETLEKFNILREKVEENRHLAVKYLSETWDIDEEFAIAILNALYPIRIRL